MGKLCYKTFGMSYGDFRPAHQTEDELVVKVVKAKSALPQEKSLIWLPRANFTNITRVYGGNGDVQPITPDFYRTHLSANGCTFRGRIAGGFFNADSPIIGLRQDDTVAVLHGGYRCLIRQKPDENNIIENAIGEFEAKKTSAVIFSGIGPCCWVPGYQNFPEILKPKPHRHMDILQKCLAKTTEKSPFGAGHVSVDLYQLSKELLKLASVPENNITIDARCTCCATEKDQPIFWSETRYRAGKQEINGQNLSLAWLE